MNIIAASDPESDWELLVDATIDNVHNIPCTEMLLNQTYNWNFEPFYARWITINFVSSYVETQTNLAGQDVVGANYFNYNGTSRPSQEWN